MLPVQYEAYGLRWMSQFPLPELQIVQGGADVDTSSVDVYIQVADLKTRWNEWDVGRDNFVARDGSLFFGLKISVFFYGTGK